MYIYQEILKCESGEISPADLYQKLLAFPGARGYTKNPDFGGGYNKPTYVSGTVDTLYQYTYSSGSADIRFCDRDRNDIFVNIPCDAMECLLNSSSPLLETFKKRPFAVLSFCKPIYLAETSEDGEVWARNNGYYSAIVAPIIF